MQYKYVFIFIGLALVTGIACYFWKQAYDKKQVLITSQKVVTAESKTNRSISFTS
jgi:hypothetical protein